MKAPKVTLEQWRVLQSVVDEGGFAQAADALHKSQSSISYAVAKLQEQLGYSLLIIDGRKAKLTDRGEVLLRRSRHLMKEAMDLEELAHTIGQAWEPELEIIVDQMFPTPVLLRALRAFELQNQGTQVHLKEEVLGDGFEVSTLGSPDLMLSSIVPKGYLTDPIINVDMIAVASPHHSLCQEKVAISDKRLSRERQVLIKGFIMESLGYDEHSDAEKNWTVVSSQSALDVVRNGAGFAWLPKADIENDLNMGKLEKLHLVSGSERRVSFHAIFCKGERAGPAARLLVELLQTECNISSK